MSPSCLVPESHVVLCHDLTVQVHTLRLHWMHSSWCRHFLQWRMLSWHAGKCSLSFQQPSSSRVWQESQGAWENQLRTVSFTCLDIEAQLSKFSDFLNESLQKCSLFVNDLRGSLPSSALSHGVAWHLRASMNYLPFHPSSQQTAAASH